MKKQMNVSAKNLTVISDNCSSLYTSKIDDLAVAAVFLAKFFWKSPTQNGNIHCNIEGRC